MSKNDQSQDTTDEGDLPPVLQSSQPPAYAAVPASARVLGPRSRLEERVIEEGDPRILEASLDGWTQDLHQPRLTR